jgi:hypothetical protein
VVSSKNLRAISAAFFSSEEMLCFSKSFLSRVLALMVVSNIMAWRSDSVGGIRVSLSNVRILLSIILTLSLCLNSNFLQTIENI